MLYFMVNELFKVKLDPQNLLTIPEFSGYHCMLLNPIPAGWRGGALKPPVVFLHNSKMYWSEAVEIF